jgi:hypothetical protein
LLKKLNLQALLFIGMAKNMLGINKVIKLFVNRNLDSPSNSVNLSLGQGKFYYEYERFLIVKNIPNSLRSEFRILINKDQ